MSVTGIVMTEWIPMNIGPSIESIALLKILYKLRVISMMPSETQYSNCSYRRVGSSIEIRGQMATTSGIANIAQLVPKSYTMDHTRPLSVSTYCDKFHLNVPIII